MCIAVELWLCTVCVIVIVNIRFVYGYLLSQSDMAMDLPRPMATYGVCLRLSGYVWVRNVSPRMERRSVMHLRELCHLNVTQSRTTLSLSLSTR